MRSRSSNEENSNDEKIYKFNITLAKDYDLKDQTNYFFNSLFNLKPLPNYFFHLQKYSPNINEIEEDITFSEHNKNLFTTFMEVDGAYINDTNKKINYKDLNYHPYALSKTFICSRKNNKFELESIKEDFEIWPKTIIINETKISFSKEQDEFKDLLTKKYNRSILAKTLFIFS